MPKELENKLMKEADKKGFSEERKNAYVYGTMRKKGWIPSTQSKAPKKLSDRIGHNMYDHKLK